MVMPVKVTLPTVEREHLDFSILEKTGRCPRLTFFNYVLARGSTAENYPINFGGAYHDFRDLCDKLYEKWVWEAEVEFSKEIQKRIYTAASSVALKDWTDPPIEHKKSYLDTQRLEETMSEAFDNWVDEKLKKPINIISTEAGFSLPLPLRLCHTCFSWSEGPECSNCKNETCIEHFAGRIDQIIEWNGRLWVRDFKTVGRKEDFKKKFNPNHQMTGYVWAAHQLSGRSIEGAIVDVVYNVKTKGPEFHPTICARTGDDIGHWLTWVYEEFANYRRFENTKTWPMRTSACNDYGGCYYREACNQASWYSIQQWLESKTEFSLWDPIKGNKDQKPAD